MNWIVFCVGTTIAMIVSLAASLYPAIRLSGVDPNRILKTGGSAGVSRGQRRLREGFVVVQLALTVVLLVVSTLLIRAVTRYRHVDLGFDPGQILTTEIDLSPARYKNRDVIANFYNPLLERVMHIPGVRSAGLINWLPIVSWGYDEGELHIADHPPYSPDENHWVAFRTVSTGYYDVFGIALHHGRGLTPSLDKAENAAATVLVNDAFVRRFIPDGVDPTTQKIDDAEKPENWTRIVGTVGSVRQSLYEPPKPEFDVLIDEVALKNRAQELGKMQLVLRFETSPRAIEPALRAAVHDIDPTVPFRAPRTMTDVVSERIVFSRMESWLYGIFTGLALLLALVGLYGLLSNEVNQSTHDIGVRIALGASRQSVLGLVMRRVVWMTGAGTAAGIMAAVLARRIIGIVIYFDASKEAAGLTLLGLLLIAVSLFVALIPALRAALIEPIQVLHVE